MTTDGGGPADDGRLAALGDATRRAIVEQLAPKYVNDVLGSLQVQRRGPATVFDVGEWQSEVATRRNDDGTVSLRTVSPGLARFAFVVGERQGKRALILRDDQHEYVFTEAP